MGVAEQDEGVGPVEGAGVGVMVEGSGVGFREGGLVGTREGTGVGTGVGLDVGVGEGCVCLEKESTRHVKMWRSKRSGQIIHMLEKLYMS